MAETSLIDRRIIYCNIAINIKLYYHTKLKKKEADV